MKRLFILFILLLPINVYGLSMECPSVASIGEEVVCRIEEEELIGVLSNISLDSGISYSNFSYNSWKSYYFDYRGFAMGMDGDNQKLEADLFLKVGDSAVVGNSYSVILDHVEGVDSQYHYVPLENIKRDIRIVSDVKTLDDIILSNGKIPIAFDKDILNYEIHTTDDMVDIKVIATDERAVVEGDIGEHHLVLGSNIFSIKVTSERGNSQVYRIVLIRDEVKSNEGKNDNKEYSNRDNASSKEEKKVVRKNTNIGLKSLSINGKAISLEKGKYHYQFDVDYDVKKLDIKGVAFDSKAAITIRNVDELVIGDNIIYILVKDSDGVEVQYSVVVTRKNQLDSNCYIKKLLIKNYFVDFHAKKFKYSLDIRDEDALDIEVLLESKTSQYKITGNSKLKDGSVIKIKVIAEDGSSKTYEIKIHKDSLGSNSESIFSRIKIPFLIIFILLMIIILILERRKKSRQL